MIQQQPKRFLRWVLTPLAGAFLILIFAAGSWALALRMTGNIHVVEPGVLYRSAQLSGDELAEVLAKYHIRSVINLRGRNRGDAWYENELRITAAHDALHFDVGMGATSEPRPKLIGRLLSILRTAPRPMLIHCYGGADRSGLAAALFERIVEGKSAQFAARQLSFWYGHFSWFGSGTAAMDAAYWRLSAMEAQKGALHK